MMNTSILCAVKYPRAADIHKFDGKTVLPHRAVATIDMRLGPDMTAAYALGKLKAHLAKHGFAAIEVNMSGGYGK
jgi:acetylornithine deacetylase/succinyl-diaminopimelate desuccinylase-like protein